MKQKLETSNRISVRPSTSDSNSTTRAMAGMVPESATPESVVHGSSGSCYVKMDEAVECLGLAMSLVDSRNDQVVWCTAAWDRAVPRIQAGDSLQSSLLAHPDIALLLERANRETTSSGPFRLDSTGKLNTVTVKSMPGEQYVLLLDESLSATAEMHHYMQARESMFTTSRTISVSEMATTLAHEIKQPIATITNILKGVRIRMKKPDTSFEVIQEALDNALEQANFTNSVINRIRDFTQARRPQQQMLDMGKLTGEALSLMDWLLSANHCRVSLSVEDSALWCKGDPTMLQQVLVNLLRNGVEAMHENHSSDRQLLVSCERKAGNVRISIRDQGHGLDGKEHTLFVPFTTSKTNGMGVGLNICRSFVELHQGRLWLTPNEDGGCTSHVELPWVDAGQPTD